MYDRKKEKKRKDKKRKEGRKEEKIVTKATHFLLHSSCKASQRAISEVTWLLFGARICGLRSQEGEILISQKYVKGRRGQGGGEEKITCRAHECQGRHA